MACRAYASRAAYQQAPAAGPLLLGQPAASPYQHQHASQGRTWLAAAANSKYWPSQTRPRQCAQFCALTQHTSTGHLTFPTMLHSTACKRLHVIRSSSGSCSFCTRPIRVHRTSSAVRLAASHQSSICQPQPRCTRPTPSLPRQLSSCLTEALLLSPLRMVPLRSPSLTFLSRVPA